jgi:predicted DNA-binding transcriptional regulator AlpA
MNAFEQHNPIDLATSIERRRAALKPAKLAELLSLSPKQIYSLIKRGILPSMRIASSIRLDPVSTAKWLRSVTA